MANLELRFLLQLGKMTRACHLNPRRSCDPKSIGTVGSWWASLAERHPQGGEQGAAVLVGARGGAKRRAHALDLVDLVVVDLRKHDLLPNAQGVVAAAVEGLGAHAAEVAHARQRERDQP